MSYDYRTMDFNTIFENMARTFALKAAEIRQEAAALLAELEYPGAAIFTVPYQTRAGQLNAKAAELDMHAKSCTEGYLLAGPMDMIDPILSQYRDVYTAACQAGRVRFSTVPGRLAPDPIGPAAAAREGGTNVDPAGRP